MKRGGKWNSTQSDRRAIAQNGGVGSVHGINCYMVLLIVFYLFMSFMSLFILDFT
jgi:hypothetical protein